MNEHVLRKLDTRGVLVVSLYPKTGVGGLAQYQRTLLHELNREGQPGASGVVLPSFMGTSPGPLHQNDDVLEFQSFTADPRFRICCKLFPRLASRPTMHPALQRLMEWLGTKAARRVPLMDVRVIHFIGAGWHMHGFWLAALARYRGISFTILPAVHPKSWGDDVIDVRLYCLADRVLCLSDHEKRHLMDLGVPPGKMIRCSLPPMCLSAGDGRSLRARLSLGDRPIVLFLGRRDHGKGYPMLLQAWHSVVASVQDAVLILAGPSGAEFEYLKSDLPSSSIRDLGVPDEQMKADALSACDIFCLPSAHESFGIVYVEAWSYGKPVICGTAPACRELIDNDEDGLWSMQEPDQIAVAICRLLKDQRLARRLGENGRRKQLAKYTHATFLGEHVEAFNDLAQ